MSNQLLGSVQRWQNGYFVVFLRFVWHRFNNSNIMQISGSLTFTTLLAIVPLLVVMLSVVTVFPIFNGWTDAFMAFVNRMIVPSGANVIADYLNDFKTQASKLTALGILGMVVTSLLLLQTVEEAFNRIWQVKQQRLVWVRFSVYWLILTLGPVILGLSLSVWASAQANLMPDWFSGSLKMLWQILYNTLILSLLYRIVPNSKVKAQHALFGAFITAWALVLAKWLFAIYVRHFNSYTLIYGAFAAIPVFLVWLHLLWTIVLTGALITSSVAYWGVDVQCLRLTQSTVWQDLVETLQLLARAQQRGEVLPLSAFWQRVSDAPIALNTLTQWGWVAKTSEGWVLTRSAHDLTWREVATKMLGDETMFNRTMIK